MEKKGNAKLIIYIKNKRIFKFKIKLNQINTLFLDLHLLLRYLRKTQICLWLSYH